MADRTGIEWTDATWNPLRGCTRISEGCRNCYAEGVAARFSGPGQAYEGLAKRTRGGPRWTGKVAFAGEKALLQPLRWRRPRRIFVNSMSDLFHEAVPDELIDRIFAVMALAPQHTFQVLTKRPERMRVYLTAPDVCVRIGAAQAKLDPGATCYERLDLDAIWPLSNVWLGTSVEDKYVALVRGAALKACPAAVRFWSAEPLLGDLGYLSKAIMPDWVIAGGESGPGARPMHPDWVRDLRDRCAAAGVPFFFKQWGEWTPLQSDDGGFWPTDTGGCIRLTPEGERRDYGYPMQRVGKKHAGRLLAGVEYNGFPA
jgi:protein gp37